MQKYSKVLYNILEKGLLVMKRKNSIDKEGVNEVVHLSKNILKLLYVVLVVGIILCTVVICQQLGIFVFIGRLLGVLSPLFIGFVIAWLFDPFVDKLTAKGLSRIVSSIIVYVIFILFLLGFFRLFIPILYDEINELLGQLPGIINSITEYIDNFFSKIQLDAGNIEAIKDNLITTINDYGRGLSENLPNTIVGIISSLASGIGNIFFGLIIGLYMLFDFDNVTHAMIRLVPKRHQKEALKLITDIGCEVRKSVNGTILVACMVFICDTVGFAVIGLNASLLFGLFCGVTDLIPYIGPYIGTAVATIVGFTQSPLIGIGVFVIAFIVQMFESYVLQPMVMSRATNLHPVTIIVGLLIFGHFFGILGMILATPILSIVKVIWQFLDKKYDFFDAPTKTVNKENS